MNLHKKITPMKKICFILTIAVIGITACQQKPKTVPVDIVAEKAALNSIFDKFDRAFDSKNVAILESFLTDDALCLGTDQSEFLNRQQMKDAWTQMFADSTLKINYLNDRMIKVSADGNSAFVVEQYIIPGICPKIPWRNGYHLVKSDGNWMILVINCGFIPKNEDIPKLNKALE
jgi:ketosteroid isomerase-like protein